MCAQEEYWCVVFITYNTFDFGVRVMLALQIELKSIRSSLIS